MKTLFSLLILVAITFSLKSQELPYIFKPKKFELDTNFKELPQLDFKKQFRYKLLHPDESSHDAEISIPPFDISGLDPGSPFFSNMPIYRPRVLAHMLVHEPDSMVKFHLLIKDLQR